MPITRTACSGLNTDSPPDQLGNGALYLKNMAPRSAISVGPRAGCEIAKSVTGAVSAGRRICLTAFADDPGFTIFVVCVNDYDSGGAVIKAEIEGIFECHLGEDSYNDVVGGLDIAETLSATTPGLYLPSAVQYGNRVFVYYPDQRPRVVQWTSGGNLGILCGIQPSISVPYITVTATNANNLVYDSDLASLNYLQIGYCYYSSARNTYSQPSPLAFYALPNPAKKIVLNGFFFCRDDATANLIDYIVVCVRSGTNGGLMAVLPDMMTSIDPTLLAGTVATTSGSVNIVGTATAFTTDFVTGDSIYINGKSYVVNTPSTATAMTIYGGAQETLAGYAYYRGPRVEFDLSPDQLQLGIDLNALAGSLYVPPAVKYCERYGERIWLAGQLSTVTFGTTHLVVTKAALDGTLALTNGSAAITGTSTDFGGQLQPYDIIGIYSANTQVTGLPVTMTAGTINSDTSVTCTGPWPESTQSNLKGVRLYRGGVCARLTTDADAFTTAHLYMNVYANGQFIGQIFDVLNAREAYLFSDTNANISSTADWELQGSNDRLWPTAYSTATPGNVPTVFPECLQLNDYQLVSQALDEGQMLTGLKSTLDEMRVAFDSCFVRMISGKEPDTPLPALRQYYGRAGCIAPRSLCKAPTGEMAWIGLEGIFIDTTSGPRNTSVELSCQALWRGGQWIARADIPDMVMCYSRELNGFVFGNFTINGVAGWWGLLTLAPQYGLFLFDNQLFTSNLIEYLNGEGRGIILGGDAIGRVKRLLYDETLLDVDLAAASTAAYTCQWREGYSGQPDGSQWTIDRVVLPGIIAPDTSTIAGNLQFYRTNFLQREAAYLDGNATYTLPFTGAMLAPAKQLKVLPFQAGNMARFHSMGLSFLSTAGAQTPANQACRPMEINSWAEFRAGE